MGSVKRARSCARLTLASHSAMVARKAHWRPRNAHRRLHRAHWGLRKACEGLAAKNVLEAAPGVVLAAQIELVAAQAVQRVGCSKCASGCATRSKGWLLKERFARPARGWLHKACYGLVSQSVLGAAQGEQRAGCSERARGWRIKARKGLRKACKGLAAQDARGCTMRVRVWVLETC